MANFDKDKIKKMKYVPSRGRYVDEDGSEFRVTVFLPPEPSLNWDGIFFCPNLQGFGGNRIRKICFRYDLGTKFLN